MDHQHPPEIRILVVEDIEADAQYAMHNLRRAGVDCLWRRVETEPELRRALHDFEPDLILSDFSLPQFDGMTALKVVQEHAPDIPFVFLSGTIGEERAIAALHAGAVDYVLKENMARLPSAVRRAISEAASRRERLRQEAQIARLNRVLRMLSGVNTLVLRTRERTDLLRETCRLAVAVGGYTAAIASASVPGFETLQPVAWHGVEEEMTEKLREYLADSPARGTSVIARAIQSGREFVCNDTSNVAATSTFDALMLHAGMRSVVALPLMVDNTAIAMLVLTARDTDVVGDEELSMLREVAGSLSFGLQYLQRDTTARFLSHFDPQTGLAKRPLFCERVQRLVSGPAGRQAHFAVVIVDIARLSVINDLFGRRTGDLLLQHVADRLKRHYPGTDQIAHFGGGTFALVKAQGARSEEEIIANGKRQDDLVFGEPFQIEGRSIPLSIVVGYALCPEDGGDATTLVQNAEAALRLARIEGRKYAHYSEAARTQSIGQLALEHQLRLALERREFELCYQPKCNVFTRCIEGAEALIRWRHPENGLVYPGVFLPVLESTGLIVQVGEWVIRQAAEDLRAWVAAGLPPVRVAVNIAPAQLRHPDFESQFRAATGEWPGLSGGIDIEITEGVLQDDSEADVRKLHNLRKSGVRIAIDDFGTGYSSLSRIASLPVDTLKIDRRFVNQALGSFSGVSLVKTIIALARTFNMTTVAEGVEKPEELEFLRQSGCDQSQGFLHSQAVPAEAFAVLLRQGKGSLLRPAMVEEPDGQQVGAG